MFIGNLLGASEYLNKMGYNLQLEGIFSPPCEHGVGHEPWQILLLLVEDELEVVAGVALVQGQSHCLKLLLALQGVQVHVKDARPEQRNY